MHTTRMGSPVRVTHDIDITPYGTVRRGETGRVAYADHRQGVIEIRLDTIHRGLDGNLLSVTPLDDTVRQCVARSYKPAVRQAYMSVALAMGALVVGVAFDPQRPLEAAPKRIERNVIMMDGRHVRLTLERQDGAEADPSEVVWRLIGRRVNDPQE